MFSGFFDLCLKTRFKSAGVSNKTVKVKTKFDKVQIQQNVPDLIVSITNLQMFSKRDLTC